MQIPRDAVLLRIFIGEDRKFAHQPLYEAVVLKAREMELAGATMLRGPVGYGKSNRLHTATSSWFSQEVPLVIEIVDAEDKVQRFADAVQGMIGDSLVTFEKVQVLRYGTG